MPFCELKDLIVGNLYKLTEIIENKNVSSGVYYLISIIPDTHRNQEIPALGFAKSLRSQPEIYLSQVHAQFGENTWRHSFWNDKRKNWDIYSPAGGETWNFSWVEVQKL